MRDQSRDEEACCAAGLRGRCGVVRPHEVGHNGARQVNHAGVVAVVAQCRKCRREGTRPHQHGTIGLVVHCQARQRAQAGFDSARVAAAPRHGGQQGKRIPCTQVEGGTTAMRQLPEGSSSGRQSGDVSGMLP